MKYDKIDNNLFINNRKKVAQQLSDKSVAIVHTNQLMHRNGDQCFQFRPSSDLFYLTGISQEKTILTLCPNHPNESLKEVLFIIKPDKKMEIWSGHKLTHDEAKDISGVKTIKYISDFDSVLRDQILQSDNIYCNINENPKHLINHLTKDEVHINKLKNEYPLHNYNRLAPVLSKLRTIKSDEEIKLMRKACNITNKAFHRVLKNLTPEMKEYEVEAEISYEFLRNGAEGHAYAPIIASGKNACILHYIDNNKTCKDGDLLLMDFGAEYANYAADCTRTIPINGKFTNRQANVYNSVLRVMKKATMLLKPGTTINEVNKKTAEYIQKECINLGLFTLDEVKNHKGDSPLYMKYYMHGCCHFIGLDVHDVGGKDTVLEKGMVLTCEPGIYIEEENIGIRIENNILVDDEPVDLMKEIPREIKDIEEIMSNR